MATPFPLDTIWENGMRRDYSRDQMPGASAWNIQDYIPGELQAPLRKRGGWTYAGGGSLAGVTQLGPLVYGAFSSNPKVLGVDQAGNLWDVLTPTNIGILGSAFAPSSSTHSTPFYYRGKAIFLANDGTTLPHYYDNSTIGTLTGALPGKYGGVFKDHAVIGGSSSFPQRLAFSNPADPTTWDLTLQVWDASFPLVGLGFYRGGILIFEQDRVERIRGSVPPPGGDFVMDTLVSTGCLDAQSIVNWNDRVIWCGAEGVFMTDGASITDLTQIGGMQKYWRDTFVASFQSSWHLVCGIYRNHLIVTLTDSSFAFQDCLVLNLITRSWWRFKNFPMTGAVQLHTNPEELYVSMGARVAKTSSCWNPTSTNKNDGDGTPVLPVVESVVHRGFIRLHRRYITSTAVQTWRAMYLDYDIRDAAADNPALRISVTGTPESSTYTQMTGGAGQQPDASATTAWKRIRRLINFPANGLAYKVEQVNASADTKLYSIEAEYAGREVSRLA